MDSQLANKEAIPRFKVPKSALSSGTGKQRNKYVFISSVEVMYFV